MIGCSLFLVLVGFVIGYFTGKWVKGVDNG